MVDNPNLPLIRAVRAGDAATVRSFLQECSDKQATLKLALQIAIWARNIEMMSLLVELGADINAPEGGGDPPAPEGVIDSAAGEGATNVVRWLLERGAKINFCVNGVTRCMPLSGAAMGGHLDVVKLLVEEAGADINATWAGMNPLTFAIMYRHKEVEAYLRSKGAVEPGLLEVSKLPSISDPILAHIEKHLGKAKPLSLREILPGDLPLTIYVVRQAREQILITSGMSSKPMNVPKGGEGFQYAEMAINLPLSWPLTEQALKDPKNLWPISWLHELARYPHENNTWLGGPSVIMANGDPPRPLASNTKLTCLLGLADPTDFGRLQLPDGRKVVFYNVFPLYTEERDLEREKGVEHIIWLFQKHAIRAAVDIKRPNVALASRRRR